MTNKDKILKAVENISDDKAKEILDFLGHKESKRFTPENGETYFTINSGGSLSSFNHNNNNVYLMMLSQGNVFKTKEEAQFEVSKRAFNTKAYWEFADNSDEIDWSDDCQFKCSVYYLHTVDQLEVDKYAIAERKGSLYTTNLDWLEQWVKDNKTDIKKFWFNQ